LQELLQKRSHTRWHYMWSFNVIFSTKTLSQIKSFCIGQMKVGQKKRPRPSRLFGDFSYILVRCKS